MSIMLEKNSSKYVNRVVGGTFFGGATGVISEISNDKTNYINNNIKQNNKKNRFK